MSKIGLCTAGAARTEGEADYQLVPVCKHSYRSRLVRLSRFMWCLPGLIHAEPRFKVPGSDQGRSLAHGSRAKVGLHCVLDNVAPVKWLCTGYPFDLHVLLLVTGTPE